MPSCKLRYYGGKSACISKIQRKLCNFANILQFYTISLENILKTKFHEFFWLQFAKVCNILAKFKVGCLSKCTGLVLVLSELPTVCNAVGIYVVPGTVPIYLLIEKCLPVVPVAKCCKMSKDV